MIVSIDDYFQKPNSTEWKALQYMKEIDRFVDSPNVYIGFPWAQPICNTSEPKIVKNLIRHTALF